MISLALLYPYPDFKNKYYDKSETINYPNPEQLKKVPESVYFELMKEISKKDVRVSYIALVTDEFAKENKIKLPYYSNDLDEDVEIVYTDSIEKISLYINQFNNLMVRGNYIFWNALTFLFPDKNYLMFPSYSKIEYDILKFNPKKKTVFVDDTHLMKSFKENDVKTVVFKKPAKNLFYEPDKKKSKKIIDFLFVCSSSDRLHKRLDLVLDMLPILTDKFKSSSFHFGIVGDIEYHKERIDELRKIKKLNITSYGRLTPYKLKSIYSKSQLTICASDIDSNPRIISESMACNTPVLCASDLAGGKFQISKQNGSFFEPTPEKLAMKLMWMLKNISTFKAKNNTIRISTSASQILKNCEVR